MRIGRVRVLAMWMSLVATFLDGALVRTALADNAKGSSSGGADNPLGLEFPLQEWGKENLKFGPQVEGLRAAVELMITNGTCIYGQPIEVRFHIRNQADYDIQIASDSWRQGDKM